MKRLHLFLSSLLLACQPAVLEQHPQQASHALASLVVDGDGGGGDPVGSGLWSHSGGPGLFPGAAAACQAFAKTFTPAYQYERVEATHNPEVMRCYTKPQHDNEPSVTPSLVGLDTTVRPDPTRLSQFKCAVRQCDRRPLNDAEWTRFVSADRDRRCAVLGEIKHACLEQSLSSNSDIRSERSFDMSQNPPQVVKDAQGNETVGYDAANAAKEAQGLGDLRRPDAIAGSGAPYEIYEAKFPCSNKVKNDAFADDERVLRSSNIVTGEDKAGTKEKGDYKRIADGGLDGHGKVHVVAPKDTRVKDCN